MENDILKLSKKTGQALKHQNLTIAAAESCTGGALLSALTDIPGSSAYVTGGIIAYSNRVKVEQLSVKKNDLRNSGAVSQPVARQMAKNVAQLLHASIGISTTGIAGPAGGSAKKPVGTVWMGFWSAEKHIAAKANFSGKRLEVKQQTIGTAMNFVQSLILNEPLPKGVEIYR